MKKDQASVSAPLAVFVSYSHRDQEALNELRGHLAPLEREGMIRLLIDSTIIQPGDDIFVELERAYGEAQVALLLVSAEYLASSSVDREVKFLLRRRSESQLSLIPIFLSPASSETQLNTIQGIGSPTRTLRELSKMERDRQYAKLAEHLRKLAVQLQPTDRSLPEPAGPQPVRLERLELQNVRGFGELILDFGSPPRPMTVVVGRNGTCKTTLLRSVVLALASVPERSALLAHPYGRWIQQGKLASKIGVKVAGEPEPRVIHLQREGREDVDVSSRRTLPPVFLCAYGMGRSAGGAEPSVEFRLHDSVASLFRYETRLAPSELVLRRLFDFLGQTRFDRVLGSLKRALGLDHRYEIRLPPGGGIEVEGVDLGAIPLDAWADGYRMTFLWLIDLFGWAMRANAFDENGDIAGLVLVDEIEQHLHPAMQRGLLAHLQAALPKVQWIVTTHSPIVALSAGQESLVALHRRGDQVVSAKVPNLVGYSAEDVLEEEALFGTDATGPETRERLDRAREIQLKPPALRTEAERAELLSLANELDPTRLPYLREDKTLAKLEEIEALLRSRKGKA